MLHAHYDCDTILSANVLFTSSLNALLLRIQKCNINNNNKNTNTNTIDEVQLSNKTYVTIILCTIINTIFSKIPLVDITISVKIDDDTNDTNDESFNDLTSFESNHFFIINNVDKTTTTIFESDSTSSVKLNNIHRTLCDVVSTMYIEYNNNNNNVIHNTDNDKSNTTNNNNNNNNNNSHVSTMLSQTSINALHIILQSVLVEELRMMIISTTASTATGTGTCSIEQQQQQNKSFSSCTNNIITEEEQYITSICYIIGTIWIVYDCLSIKSFSCSTIPIHNLFVLRHLSHHFINVPINIIVKSDEETHNDNNKHKDFYLHIDGLVLLRQLLEYSSNKNSSNNSNDNNMSGPPCPFRLIQPVSIGSINTNYNNTSQRHCIYLLLGTVYDSTNSSVSNSNDTLLQFQDYQQQQSSLQNLQKSSSSSSVSSGSLLKDVIWTEMILIEANIDDMTSEHLAYACDVLLNDGKAADVWTTSIYMKKGRSAHTLHCLCSMSILDSILVLLFQNTTTLGIRIQHINRVSLHRTIVSIPISSCCPLYEEMCTSMSTVDVVDDDKRQQHHQKLCNIDVKIGYLNGTITSIKAEFDHCQTVSKVTGIPINTIATAAVDVALEKG